MTAPVHIVVSTGESPDEGTWIAAAGEDVSGEFSSVVYVRQDSLPDDAASLVERRRILAYINMNHSEYGDDTMSLVRRLSEAIRAGKHLAT